MNKKLVSLLVLLFLVISFVSSDVVYAGSSDDNIFDSILEFFGNIFDSGGEEPRFSNGGAGMPAGGGDPFPNPLREGCGEGGKDVVRVTYVLEGTELCVYDFAGEPTGRCGTANSCGVVAIEMDGLAGGTYRVANCGGSNCDFVYTVGGYCSAQCILVEDGCQSPTCDGDDLCMAPAGGAIQCVEGGATGGEGGGALPSGTYSIQQTDEYHVESHCGGGSNPEIWPVVMTPVSNSMCFLTDVQFEDLDSDDEWGKCYIEESDDNWVLYSFAQDDSDTWCSAHCLQWTENFGSSLEVIREVLLEPDTITLNNCHEDECYCGLSDVLFKEIDAEADRYTYCDVGINSDGYWFLTASQSSDANAQCSITCLSWENVPSGLVDLLGFENRQSQEAHATALSLVVEDYESLVPYAWDDTCTLDLVRIWGIRNGGSKGNCSVFWDADLDYNIDSWWYVRARSEAWDGDTVNSICQGRCLIWNNNVQYDGGDDCVELTDDMLIDVNTPGCVDGYCRICPPEGDYYHLPSGIRLGGFGVNSDDLTIDCDGAELRGDGVPDSIYGIKLSMVHNAVVMNCKFSEYSTGVWDSSGLNNIIRDNYFDGCGIWLYTSNGANIINNEIYYDTLYGFDTGPGTSNAVLTDNTICYSGAEDIHCTAGSTISGTGNVADIVSSACGDNIEYTPCPTTPTHNECINGICTAVDGAGVDECSPVGSVCGAGETHNECINNVCIVVDGAGTDGCTNPGGPCGGGEVHKECRGDFCVPIQGPGADECQTDEYCALQEEVCGDGIVGPLGPEECDCGDPWDPETCDFHGATCPGGEGELYCIGPIGDGKCTINYDGCGGDSHICGDGVIDRPNDAGVNEDCDNCPEDAGCSENTYCCDDDENDFYECQDDPCDDPPPPGCGDGICDDDETCDCIDCFWDNDRCIDDLICVPHPEFDGCGCDPFGEKPHLCTGFPGLQDDVCCRQPCELDGGNYFCRDPPDCGNGNLDSGENCDNCPEDAGCLEGEVCCEGVCLDECGSPIECGDPAICEFEDDCRCPECDGEQDGCRDTLICVEEECGCPEQRPNFCENEEICCRQPCDAGGNCPDPVTCPNGELDPGENCQNCPEDAGCINDEVCCDDNGVIECKASCETIQDCGDPAICEWTDSCICPECSDKKDACYDDLVCMPDNTCGCPVGTEYCSGDMTCCSVPCTDFLGWEVCLGEAPDEPIIPEGECGNGVLEWWEPWLEECDDGNQDDTDDCGYPDCKYNANYNERACGNDIIENFKGEFLDTDPRSEFNEQCDYDPITGEELLNGCIDFCGGLGKVDQCAQTTGPFSAFECRCVCLEDEDDPSGHGPRVLTGDCECTRSDGCPDGIGTMTEHTFTWNTLLNQYNPAPTKRSLECILFTGGGAVPFFDNFAILLAVITLTGYFTIISKRKH